MNRSRSTSDEPPDEPVWLSLAREDGPEALGGFLRHPDGDVAVVVPRPGEHPEPSAYFGEFDRSIRDVDCVAPASYDGDERLFEAVGDVPEPDRPTYIFPDRPSNEDDYQQAFGYDIPGENVEWVVRGGRNDLSTIPVGGPESSLAVQSVGFSPDPSTTESVVAVTDEERAFAAVFLGRQDLDPESESEAERVERRAEDWAEEFDVIDNGQPTDEGTTVLQVPGTAPPAVVGGLSESVNADHVWFATEGEPTLEQLNALDDGVETVGVQSRADPPTVEVGEDGETIAAAGRSLDRARREVDTMRSVADSWQETVDDAHVVAAGTDDVRIDGGDLAGDGPVVVAGAGDVEIATERREVYVLAGGGGSVDVRGEKNEVRVVGSEHDVSVTGNKNRVRAVGNRNTFEVEGRQTVEVDGNHCRLDVDGDHATVAAVGRGHSARLDGDHNRVAMEGTSHHVVVPGHHNEMGVDGADHLISLVDESERDRPHPDGCMHNDLRVDADGTEVTVDGWYHEIEMAGENGRVVLAGRRNEVGLVADDIEVAGATERNEITERELRAGRRIVHEGIDGMPVPANRTLVDVPDTSDLGRLSGRTTDGLTEHLSRSASLDGEGHEDADRGFDWSE